MTTKLVALVAAHNEEASIRATLLSLLRQDRRADRIVVAVDNCTDATLAIAQSVPGVTVFETEGNRAKKPGALNQAWLRYCGDADLIVCVDADTILERDAFGGWEREFADDDRLGGCSAKFTMLVDDSMTFSQRLLVRLQRAEFAKWTDLSLRRGRTSVLAGTACCLRNSALRGIADRRRRSGEGWGPWIETSLVEDFELTYRMRELGWRSKVSTTVRAYTDAMTDLRSLWAQRMKWQTGTVEDLLRFGVNPLTRFDWWQQLQGMLAVAIRVAWIVLLVAGAVMGTLQLQPLWLIPPALFLANDVKQSFRIPHRTAADVLVAALLVPQELFAFMRAGWFLMAWSRVLDEKVVGIQQRDRWALQAEAEVRRRAAGASMAATRS